MTIKKVEIISDENGTRIKLNDRDELKGVTFIQFKASHSDVAELALRIDVIPDSIKDESGNKL